MRKGRGERGFALRGLISLVNVVHSVRRRKHTDARFRQRENISKGPVEGLGDVSG